MTEITISIAGVKQVRFDVDQSQKGPAFFFLSVRKCGSSLFNMIARQLAMANRRDFVDIAGTFFSANVQVHDWIDDPALTRLLFAGNAYGGFRNMPVAWRTSELFRDGPKILFVRDPRDALVSEYFSVAHSHRIPESADGRDNVARMMRNQRRIALESDIDSWVIKRAPAMATTMLAYAELVGSPTTRTLRYEDVIFDKKALILAIARHFSWVAHDALIRSILDWADIRPAVDDPTALVRKVTPGDHLQKLRPATIASVSKTLAPALELFQYAKPDSTAASA